MDLSNKRAKATTDWFVKKKELQVIEFHAEDMAKASL